MGQILLLPTQKLAYILSIGIFMFDLGLLAYKGQGQAHFDSVYLTTVTDRDSISFANKYEVA